MTWQAVVEIWPSETLLFVPALPGFQVNAPSPEEALADAGQRIDSFIQWVLECELADALPTGERITIAEEASAVGKAGPFFESDSLATDSDHNELALAVGRAALSDLLFALDDVPLEHKQSAERTLRHVAEIDRWYATRLAPAQGSPFAAIEDELVQSASLFEETVDALHDADRPVKWALDGETWSVRKALRRRTGHLREHLVDLLRLAG
jgi:hypothetical protein